MSADSIVEALPRLEPDPQQLWDMIEKHYRPNFFEGIIIKRYSVFFENRDEVLFN
jgi:hypothetical protein